VRHILDIGHNDLRLFLKRKSAYVWLFAIPLAFTYFMGFANRGPGDPYNRKPSVLVENQDPGFLGRILLDEMGSQGMNSVDPNNAASASRGVRIPSDFTQNILNRTQAKVQFFRKEGSSEADAILIEVRLVRALVALNGHILEAVTDPNHGGALTEAGLREVMASPNPVRLDARFAGRKPVPSGFSFSLPGNLVMYLVMNLLIFGGATVAGERRGGIIKRLWVHPVTRLELVAGKVYGLMLLGMIQIAFFMVVGRFLFHVNLGANLPAVVTTLLLLAWVAASLGVFVGSLFTAEERVAGLCVLAGLLMAALGGCWWPLEIGPPVFKTISLCLPSGWALAALHQLISFGSDSRAVLTPWAVLLAFGAAANLLAARFFRV
jgi:ABC-2 type transport system permease protein